MRAGQPSGTARGAAAHRAVHQATEGGAIFRDPLAAAILDQKTRDSLPEMMTNDSLRPMRLFVCARSRFCEDTIASCVARGVRQVVVLGAGLDTFSLRNPHARLGLRIIEVDHPATQQWKRERIKAAGLAEPAWLAFAPIDFEHESLAQALARAGFAADAPAVFQGLGVVPYLTPEAVSSTLQFIGDRPGAAVVFDYAEPFDNYAIERRASIMATAERAAARGEPWLSLFEPGDLHDLLRRSQFERIEDLGGRDIAERFYGAWANDITLGAGPHLVRAQR